MTIPYCIQIGKQLNDREIIEVESIILSTFSEIDRIYNNWNVNSEISQLNQMPAYEKILLSKELASFLNMVDKMVDFTDGRFDPTVAPLQQQWLLHLKDGHILPLQLQQELQNFVGWEKIHLENGYFWKDHSLTALDLNGIAKGYAVDLMVEKLKIAGYNDIYAEWGGEIRTIGCHPKRRPWKICIKGLCTIDLADTAIATSGSYLQYWIIDDIYYTHIIDPRTKQPVQNSVISSVSVIASTCAEADALATASMLFPSIEAAEQWALEKKLKVFIW